MAKTQELFYALVGAGDFAVEKVKGVSQLADRKTADKVYKDFVKRGRSLTTKIRNADATKQAVAQTRVARTQVKAAATGVTKAARADAKATRSAASKTTAAG